MPRALRAVIVMVGCLSASGAFAHHSHAMYDTSAKVTILGTIVAFHWMNPHVWVYLESTDANGRPVQGVLEGNSPANLSRRGWSATSFKAGDKVSAIVHPSKEGATGGLLGSLVIEGKNFDGD